MLYTRVYPEQKRDFYSTRSTERVELVDNDNDDNNNWKKSTRKWNRVATFSQFYSNAAWSGAYRQVGFTSIFFFVVVVGSTLSDVYAPRDPSHTQDEEGLCLYIFPGGSGQKGRPVCEQMNAHTQFAKWANTFFLWGFNSLGEDRKWLEQRRFRIGRPDSITVDSIFSSQFFLFHP